MISIHWLILASFLTAVAFVIGGYLRLLVTWVLCWVDRRDIPNAEDLLFSKFFGISDYGDYSACLWTHAVALFLALLFLTLCIKCTPILFIAGIAALVAGGMYAARWMLDTKKAVDKIKESGEE